MAADNIIETTLAKFNRGIVMVITGNGKGKTTAAVGQALRALGHGRKVFMIQFMKGKKYGEVLAALRAARVGATKPGRWAMRKPSLVVNDEM